MGEIKLQNLSYQFQSSSGQVKLLSPDLRIREFRVNEL